MEVLNACYLLHIPHLFNHWVLENAFYMECDVKVDSISNIWKSS